MAVVTLSRATHESNARWFITPLAYGCSLEHVPFYCDPLNSNLRENKEFSSRVRFCTFISNNTRQY